MQRTAAILYKQTPLATPIAFSANATSIIDGPYLDPTSTKQNITNELVVIVSGVVTNVNNKVARSVICASPNQAPAVEAGPDQTVSPSYVLRLTASDGALTSGNVSSTADRIRFGVQPSGCSAQSGAP